MRLAIYSSNRGSTMKKTIERGSVEFQNDIKLFFSDDPRTEHLRGFLEERGIAYILSPLRLRGLSNIETVRRAYWDRFLTILQEYQIDYVFCNGNHLIQGEILEKYKNKIINFHGALLPSYPGRMATDRMLEKKEFLIGSSAIFVDENMDTGPIIMEAVLPACAIWDETKSGEARYDIAKDAQISMIYKVHQLLKENRIEVEGNRVTIRGADYSAFSVFPQI